MEIGQSPVLLEIITILYPLPLSLNMRFFSHFRIYFCNYIFYITLLFCITYIYLTMNNTDWWELCYLHKLWTNTPPTHRYNVVLGENLSSFLIQNESGFYWEKPDGFTRKEVYRPHWSHSCGTVLSWQTGEIMY